MANIKHKIDNAGNKVAGKIKESVGKATVNEKLEAEGKIQSTKAAIKGKIEKITDK
ncbi:MAG: CsbD family protein [Tenericutes bacterium HGW-Tenericutes-8]|nr:MAG: CsbD family protein [Tenericutes bacterium HGW-Tenericutes-8]